MSGSAKAGNDLKRVFKGRHANLIAVAVVVIAMLKRILSAQREIGTELGPTQVRPSAQPSVGNTIIPAT
jgi:hypothetical protein